MWSFFDHNDSRLEFGDTTWQSAIEYVWQYAESDDESAYVFGLLYLGTASWPMDGMFDDYSPDCLIDNLIKVLLDEE